MVMIFLNHQKNKCSLCKPQYLREVINVKVNKLGECCCPNCGGIVQFIEWNFVDSELNLEETYKLTIRGFIYI